MVLLAHLRVLGHAGGLERDECNSAAFATLPSFTALVSRLRYDTVPLASTLMFRSWVAIGLGSDAGLRTLGLLVGLALVAALAWNARLHRAPLPAASLLLLALHPDAVRWSDAIRPVGLGMLAIVLAFGLMWRALWRPGAMSVALASAAALLSVQTLYPNALLLLGICAAGALTARGAGLGRRALLPLAIGLIAALSLLADLPALRAAREWTPLLWTGAGHMALWGALASPHTLDAWLWVGAAAAGLALAVARGRGAARAGETSAPPTGRDTARYAGLAVGLGAAALLLALAAGHVDAEPWYYLPLMALACAGLDVLFAPLLGAGPRRTILALALVAFSIGRLIASLPILDERRTNVDLVAARLAAEASARDLVIVNPWYLGVSFHRYAPAGLRWTTIPPLADNSVHRFDLLRRQMESTGVMDTLLARVTGTLESGARVWVVGSLPRPGTGTPTPPPAATGPPWQIEAWCTGWALQVSALIAAHAQHGRTIPVPAPGVVSPAEEAGLHVAEGWR